jgi:O-methyltransferase
MGLASSAVEDQSLAEFAPEQSFALLRKLIPARLQPTLRGIRKRWERRRLSLAEPYHAVYAYTQMSLSRQQNLVRICEILEEDGIPGSIVECGVLDGGGSALMAYATRRSGRPVHMFDSWDGLPVAAAGDGAVARKWVGQCVGSPTRVFEIMKALNIEPSRLHAHRGWFHETFPQAAETVGSPAMLHVDCDFYEPVLLTLETWYPKLVPGGFVQIDDYEAFSGCRKATDEFLTVHRETQLEFWGAFGRAIYLRKPVS